MRASLKFERPPSTVFHAITHVWGRKFLDLFLNLCIPNQLAPGNVPALPSGSRYRILTSAMHVDELHVHPMVQALRAVIPVDIIVVDAIDRLHGAARGHELMIACHRQAVADALDAGAALIFLSADFIFSDGSFATVVRQHRAGYRAVVNTGLRLAKESFLQSLDESTAGVAAPAGRELVRMALPHLHPHTQSMFADARSFRRFPVAVYWHVGNQGLLARCFSLHPLMVDPIVPVLPKKSTIDCGYLNEACPDAARVHVVSDSDELQMFELTTVKRYRGGGGPRRASAWRVTDRAASCDDFQLGYWRQHPVRLHTGDFDERWSAAAATADAFTEKVLRLCKYKQVARRSRRLLEREWLLHYARRYRDRYQRAWRRCLPRVTLRQILRATLKRILRPVRLAAHRSTKTLRKTLVRTTRRVSGRARAQ